MYIQEANVEGGGGIKTRKSFLRATADGVLNYPCFGGQYILIQVLLITSGTKKK
jgi:hypothetical protein